MSLKKFNTPYVGEEEDQKKKTTVDSLSETSTAATESEDLPSLRAKLSTATALVEKRSTLRQTAVEERDEALKVTAELKKQCKEAVVANKDLAKKVEEATEAGKAARLSFAETKQKVKADARASIAEAKERFLLQAREKEMARLSKSKKRLTNRKSAVILEEEEHLETTQQKPRCGDKLLAGCICIFGSTLAVTHILLETYVF